MSHEISSNKSLLSGTKKFFPGISKNPVRNEDNSFWSHVSIATKEQNEDIEFVDPSNPDFILKLNHKHNKVEENSDTLDHLKELKIDFSLEPMNMKPIPCCAPSRTVLSNEIYSPHNCSPALETSSDISLSYVIDNLQSDKVVGRDICGIFLAFILILSCLIVSSLFGSNVFILDHSNYLRMFLDTTPCISKTRITDVSFMDKNKTDMAFSHRGFSLNPMAIPFTPVNGSNITQKYETSLPQKGDSLIYMAHCINGGDPPMHKSLQENCHNTSLDAPNAQVCARITPESINACKLVNINTDNFAEGIVDTVGLLPVENQLTPTSYEGYCKNPGASVDQIIISGVELSLLNTTPCGNDIITPDISIISETDLESELLNKSSEPQTENTKEDHQPKYLSKIKYIRTPVYHLLSNINAKMSQKNMSMRV